VTLWSPTHLMLVGGGGLATIAVRLMLIEGRPAGGATALGRAIAALSLGAILVRLPASRVSSTASAFPSSR
jgi:hypothetical protein